MNLIYKPDWEQTKQNYLSWWAHEYFGRCALSVTAPISGGAAPPSLPDKMEDRWLDHDYLIAKNNYELSHAFYGAEAFPTWHPGFPGMDTHAVYLGCDVAIQPDTAWIWPIMEEGNLTDHDFRNLKVDTNSRWYRFGTEIRELAVRQSRGRCIPNLMCVGACGDTLSFIRTTNRLLFDVIECPEYVREFELYLMRQWCEIYEDRYAQTHEQAEGSTCWFTLWSPGKFYAAQNDFAYMISPKMFEDIFLPAIELQTNYLDNCVYHVDGVGNFNHVDTLLQLPRLQAFQILPGTGMPSPLTYMNVLKKVQAAGKNLHISIPASEVMDALENLSARGLYISTACDTPEEAQALIKCAEKWSVDKKIHSS